ncbi:MAG: ATP-binding protein [Gammaproteobacteria bacterium]
MNAPATQRIVKVRREYNTWVANETLEDYALRFAPRAFRKWSEWRVANTAIGAVSFLALEAIGGSIALNYGFTNAFWAIVVVGLIIFLTGLPISYYAAKHGIDMDLLTRGAGFGYLGSTITSLIYASFTFIFFAIEAAIMALALELYFGIPLSIGYLLCSLAIIPLVTHGITIISRLQMWTQPVWIVLLVLPYVFVAWKNPDALSAATTFTGKADNGAHFDPLLFGAAATVAFSLIAQIGEQADYLRFLPEKRRANRGRWWAAMLSAGPGWIVPGAAKMLGGAFLAFLALQHEIPFAKAVEPTQMYLVAYQYVFPAAGYALLATAAFVIVSQVKINVTNAYAGSLAWSNFFSRLTHSHPGRVVWLVFNVIIAVLLMELGVFKALEHVLGLYSNVAIAWVGTLVADLVVNKPLGLSPRTIEFRRAYLYDINPVGVGSMLVASILSIAAYAGLFGEYAQAFAPFIALITAFACAPAIAALTRGKYYLARQDPRSLHADHMHRCIICENDFESDDMAQCPAYGGPICSLCCTIESRCRDRCRREASVSHQWAALLEALLPPRWSQQLLQSQLGHYLLVLLALTSVLAMILGLMYYQEAVVLSDVSEPMLPTLRLVLLKVFAVLLLTAAIGAWWVVLANRSREVAHKESEWQMYLLTREIEAHRLTTDKLQRAKESAEHANDAKSRYVTRMSHELRSPLNSILGYAQLLQKDRAIPAPRRDAIGVIHRSGEHLLSLIDGLLDIARIEAGKLQLDQREVRLSPFIDQIAQMFRLQAEDKGLRFSVEIDGRLPAVVHADEGRLRQILINLLSNAVKFTDTGSVTLRVRYRGELAHFEIEDTGIGIAAPDLERVFLPFERAQRRHDGGTGLGLTISSMLTKLMGGQLTVVSTPGGGSRFDAHVYLPEVASPKTVAPVEAPKEIIGYRGPRRNVLVVDDQAPQRQLIANILAPLGFEVRQAGDGVECFHEVAARQPDAILLDIVMPGASGWEVCGSLRANGATRAPIIIVSADAIGNPAARVAGGADDFILKPVLATELLETLQRHLNLEWIYGARPDVDDAPAKPAASPPLPPQEHIRALIELGHIGYVKGILDKLDDIERLDPQRYGEFTRDLRTAVKGFQLDKYTRLLRQALDHAVAAA